MSDLIDAAIGQRMLRRRRLMGLTQSQLAEAIGVRFQQVQKYECGANRVSAARLWRISQALEVTVEYFFLDLEAGFGSPARDNVETLKLVRAFDCMASRPRRRLLQLARSLKNDTEGGA